MKFGILTFSLIAIWINTNPGEAIEDNVPRNEPERTQNRHERLHHRNIDINEKNNPQESAEVLYSDENYEGSDYSYGSYSWEHEDDDVKLDGGSGGPARTDDGGRYPYFTEANMIHSKVADTKSREKSGENSSSEEDIQINLKEKDQKINKGEEITKSTGLPKNDGADSIKSRNSNFNGAMHPKVVGNEEKVAHMVGKPTHHVRHYEVKAIENGNTESSEESADEQRETVYEHKKMVANSHTTHEQPIIKKHDIHKLPAEDPNAHGSLERNPGNNEKIQIPHIKVRLESKKLDTVKAALFSGKATEHSKIDMTGIKSSKEEHSGTPTLMSKLKSSVEAQVRSKKAENKQYVNKEFQKSLGKDEKIIETIIEEEVKNAEQSKIRDSEGGNNPAQDQNSMENEKDGESGGQNFKSRVQADIHSENQVSKIEENAKPEEHAPAVLDREEQALKDRDNSITARHMKDMMRDRLEKVRQHIKNKKEEEKNNKESVEAVPYQNKIIDGIKKELSEEDTKTGDILPNNGNRNDSKAILISVSVIIIVTIAIGTILGLRYKKLSFGNVQTRYRYNNHALLNNEEDVSIFNRETYYEDNADAAYTNWKSSRA